MKIAVVRYYGEKIFRHLVFREEVTEVQLLVDNILVNKVNKKITSKE